MKTRRGLRPSIMGNYFWVRGKEILNVTGQLSRTLIASRARYMKPLFWQALKTRANFSENPWRTSIDRTNDSDMKSEGNALVRVSDPP